MKARTKYGECASHTRRGHDIYVFLNLQKHTKVVFKPLKAWVSTKLFALQSLLKGSFREQNKRAGLMQRCGEVEQRESNFAKIIVG